MHELVRSMFARLPDFDSAAACTNCVENSSIMFNSHVDDSGKESGEDSHKYRNFDNGIADSDSSKKSLSSTLTLDGSFTANSKAELNDKMVDSSIGEKLLVADLGVLTEPYGVTSIIEIFHFLCSLLNIVETVGLGTGSNHLALDEDVPLFALGLINSAIELGGSTLGKHPNLLALV